MVAKPRMVDLTEVSSGVRPNPIRIPAGDYTAKIIDVEDKDSKAGNPMWVFSLRVKGSSGTYQLHALLTGKSAFRTMEIFTACGHKLASKRQQLDPGKLIGKTVGVTMVNDTYEGKAQSKIDRVFSADLIEDEAKDAEVNAPTGAADNEEIPWEDAGSVVDEASEVEEIEPPIDLIEE